MIKLHPQIIGKDGKKQFVVLPFEEYERIKDKLQDYEDLQELREAKASDAGKDGFNLNEAKEKLGI
ncbi:Phd_YefM [Sedimentisphaera cyanobacteriorum]|uniref:Phd_YefM n=1 Tax=Sedimentisphaera cyanobacteriorum TaxID=1940790 RepID=A0A1Q2HQU9_9BACT|nr:type II toxin-antitoxin system Phd/YefM family antitoxin [Sedimentisphaera cyanobacteriorum]AQQ09615.1 Phd_YefM [Sedimentisphaera cyanobacteriorum]